MAIAQLHSTNRADLIAEIVTEADMDALNAALLDNGIDADRVISILPIAAQTLASVAPAQFRVIYRVH